MSVSPQAWESFLRLLLDQLNTLYQEQSKADVVILLGRTDKQGEMQQPELRVMRRFQGG